MLCSSPAGKSGSNWLDRLRSIKGIPTGDDLDLDSFLSNSDHTTIIPRNRSRVPELPASDPTPMTTLLADLFNMGGSLSRTGKKCPRKQTNPKSFVVSSLTSTNGIHCAPNDHNSVPCTNFNLSSSNNNFVLGIGTKQDEDVEDESGGWNDLKGFSKSEVTVIDTSSSEWKADKFVFRKNNVWKVRDKKTNKNKSKGSSGSHNNKELQFLESNLDANMLHSLTPTTQGQNAKQEMKDVNNEGSPEDHEPKPPFRKRFNFPGHFRNQQRKTYVSL